jgi:chemotaxis protein MotB
MAAKKEAAHGGAWKVAYADFVTAMMALFMVLWISAQDPKIVIATSKYFQNPFHSATQATSGVLPFNNEKATHGQSADEGGEKEKDATKQIKLTFLNTVAADFYRLLHLDENLAQKPIDIQVTTDGLRITLFDRAQQPLFVGNTAQLTEWGTFVLQNMAWEIDRHQFRVVIDGHTRAKLEFKDPKPDYGAWDLSTDRGQAARRVLVHYAVDEALIDRVSGYGDTRPLGDEPPESESNQRITLSLTLKSKDTFKDRKLVDKPIPAEVSTVKPTS